MNPTSYSLSSAQLRHALSVLKEERAEYAPQHWQRVVMRLLQITAFGFFASLIWSVVMFALGDSLSNEKLNELGAVGLIPLLVFGFLTPALFLFNLPMTIGILRQLQRMRVLGLRASMLTTLGPKPGSRRLAFAANVVAILIGFSIAWAGMTLAVSGVREDEGTFAVVLGISVSLFGLVLLATPLLVIAQRRLSRLDAIDELLAALESGAAGPEEGESDSAVMLSPQRARQLSMIEQSHIHRLRTEAIREVLGEGEGTDYAVLRSREFQDACTKLDDGSRFRVERRLEELTAEPRPASASRSGDRIEVFEVPVPETPLRLVFSVDDRARRVRVFGFADDDIADDDIADDDVAAAGGATAAPERGGDDG